MTWQTSTQGPFPVTVGPDWREWSDLQRRLGITMYDASGRLRRFVSGHNVQPRKPR
jgi:hypothetical protein